MRLIDADILDKALTSLRFTADGKLAHWGDRKEWCLHGSEIETLIANAPTVEAEPIRHGEWLDSNAMYDIWRCSVCRESIDMEERPAYKYCPHCGARMQGDAILRGEQNDMEK